MEHFIDLIVPRYFREDFIKAHPYLSTVGNDMCIAYMRLYQMLYENNTEYINIYWQRMNCLYSGTSLSYDSKKALKLGKFLQTFNDNILELDIIDAIHYLNNSSTRIKVKNTKDILPVKFRMVDDLVFFATGVPVTKAYLNNMRDILKMKLTTRAVNELLIERLNAQSTAAYTSIFKKNTETVIDHLNNSIEFDNLQQQRNFFNFYQVIGGGKPIYRSVENSDRIFAINLNINSLHRSIRKMLLKGCISMDMRSSQIALLNSLFPTEYFTELLKNKISIWKLLDEQLGTSGEYKDSYKVAIYSLLYGASIKNAKAKLAESANQDVAERFFKCRFFMELKNIRKIAWEHIVNHGGLTDYNGEFIKFDPKTHSNEEPTYKNSVLCRVLQNNEYYIMSRVCLQLFESYDRFNCLSFLHDGMTMNVSNKNQVNAVIKLAQTTFNTIIADKNVFTELETEVL